MQQANQLTFAPNGKTSLILVAGEVHLHHSRPRFRSKTKLTLCGAALRGHEQHGHLDLADTANLYAMQICPSCVREFAREGHITNALAILAGQPGQGSPVLAGQMGLFDS